MISIAIWQAKLSDKYMACVETDCKATVFACAKLSSITPSMNALAAEIGLRVVRSQIELDHVSGVSNCEADALSRLCAGKAIPCTSCRLSGPRRLCVTAVSSWLGPKNWPKPEPS